jgi:hypothetical protein
MSEETKQVKDSESEEVPSNEEADNVVKDPAAKKKRRKKKNKGDLN